jgi:hypothetical protein
MAGKDAVCGWSVVGRRESCRNGPEGIRVVSRDRWEVCSVWHANVWGLRSVGGGDNGNRDKGTRVWLGQTECVVAGKCGRGGKRVSAVAIEVTGWFCGCCWVVWSGEIGRGSVVGGESGQGLVAGRGCGKGKNAGHGTCVDHGGEDVVNDGGCGCVAKHVQTSL